MEYIGNFWCKQEFTVPLWALDEKVGQPEVAAIATSKAAVATNLVACHEVLILRRVSRCRNRPL